MFGRNLINPRKICSLALKIMNPASNSYKGKNLKCKTVAESIGSSGGELAKQSAIVLKSAWTGILDLF